MCCVETRRDISPRVVRIWRKSDDARPIRLVVDQIHDGELRVPMEAFGGRVTPGETVDIEIPADGSAATPGDPLAPGRFKSLVSGVEVSGEGVFVSLLLPPERGRRRMSDQRRAARARIERAATASVLDAQMHPGKLMETQVTNISATGMLIHCGEQVPAGSRLVASIDVADHLVNVIGRVLGTGPHDTVRVEFESLSDRALAAIAVEVANLTGADSPYSTSPQLAQLKVPRAVREAYEKGRNCRLERA